MGTAMTALNDLRGSMITLLEKAWDGISSKDAPIPDWLAGLALQLQLWVGDELSEAFQDEGKKSLYYVAGWDEPSAGVRRIHRDMDAPWDARQSDRLYLRAITDSYFVDVEVEKVMGTAEPTDIKLFVVPRDRLRKLSVSEMATRGDVPDALRMTLTYDGDARSFDIPRGENREATWRESEGLAVFRELQSDLWREPVQGGKPHFRL